MWFWFALAAAILGSVETYANKKALHTVSPYLMTWAAFALNTPLVLLFLYKEGFSSFNWIFFAATTTSSVVFVVSKVLKNQTMKVGLLSKLIPLSAFGSFFTYLLGLFFLGENIKFVGVMGLFLIMFGTYTLNIDKAKEHFLEPFKFLFKDKISLVYLFAVLLNSVASLSDKIGLSNTFPSNPSMELLVENVIMTAILTVLMVKKEKLWKKELKSNFWILFIYSTIYAVVSLLIFIGFTTGPIALVMGVKKLELLFTLVLGYLFLNDKPPKHAWIATAILLLGIVLVRMA